MMARFLLVSAAFYFLFLSLAGGAGFGVALPAAIKRFA